MRRLARLRVGLLLAVLVPAAIWWWRSVIADDGIDRRIFANSPGTVYAGAGYVPLPRLAERARTKAESDDILRLRQTPLSAALALLGPPDARFGSQDAVLVWHSAIHPEGAVEGRWQVAHVVCVVDGTRISAIAVVGSFGTVQVCDPPGAVGAGP